MQPNTLSSVIANGLLRQAFTALFRENRLNFLRHFSFVLIILFQIGCVSNTVVEKSVNFDDLELMSQSCPFAVYECVTRSYSGLRNPELGMIQSQNAGVVRAPQVLRSHVQSYLLRQIDLVVAANQLKPMDATSLSSAIDQYCQQQISDDINFIIKIQDVAWQKYFVGGSNHPLFSVSVLYLIPKPRYQQSLELVVLTGTTDKNLFVSQFFKSVALQIATRKS